MNGYETNEQKGKRYELCKKQGLPYGKVVQDKEKKVMYFINFEGSEQNIIRDNNVLRDCLEFCGQDYVIQIVKTNEIKDGEETHYSGRVIREVRLERKKVVTTPKNHVIESNLEWILERMKTQESGARAIEQLRF